MTDRPILFSREMVRALLAGRKTQTRRIIDFPGIENVMDFVKVATDAKCRPVYEMKNATGSFVTRPSGKNLVDYHYMPPVGVGDRLWVREAWFAARSLNHTPPREITQDADIEYDATKRSYAEIGLVGKLRPSMFMPRWASRITLIVKDVKIARLQDISEADAIAEGIELVRESEQWGKHWRNYGADGFDDRSAKHSYRTLWNSLRGHTGSRPLTVEPWSENPWVVAYTFVTINANIDKVAT